jgi:glutathione S-transferase
MAKDRKRMKLIGSLTSPYVRKARVVLAEKKIDYDFELDSPWTPENQVANVNPLGKIPVLMLDDDTVLFDSRVIVEYLDNVAPNNKLMPGAKSRTLRGQALGSTGRRRLRRCRTGLPRERSGLPPSRVSTGSPARKTKIIRSWGSCRANLATIAWCMGTHFSLADVDRRLCARLSCFPFSRDRLAGQAPQPRSPLQQGDAATGLRGHRAAGVIG